MTTVTITPDTTPDDAAIAIINAYGELFAVSLAAALQRHCGLDETESTQERIRRNMARRMREREEQS